MDGKREAIVMRGEEGDNGERDWRGIMATEISGR